MAGYMFFDTFYPDVKGIYYETNRYNANLEYCGLLTNDGIEMCSNEVVRGYLQKDFPELPVLSIKKDIIPAVDDFFFQIFKMKSFSQDGQFCLSEWKKYLTSDEIDAIFVEAKGLSSSEKQFPVYGINEFALMFTQFASTKNLEKDMLSLTKNKAFMKTMLKNMSIDSQRKDWDTNPMTKENAAKEGWEIKDGVIVYTKNWARELTIPTSIDGTRINQFKVCSFFQTRNTLESITIPESITSIDFCPGDDFKCLKQFVSKSSRYRVEDNRYLVCNANNALISAAVRDLDVIKIPNGIKIINTSCFYRNSWIEEVYVSDGVEEICDSTFSNCLSLKKIEIPDSVKRIGRIAFCGCEHLSDVRLSDMLETLSIETFESCKNLQTITLPKKLKAIEESAFAHCTNLESVIFFDDIETIGKKAFYQCFNLQAVIPDNASIKSNAFFNTVHIEYHGKSTSKNDWGAGSLN